MAKPATALRQSPFLIAEQTLLVVFAGVLLWAPIPLASNRWWSLGVLAAALWMLLLTSAALVAAQTKSILSRLLLAKWPLLLMSAFSALVGLQVAGVLASADVFQTRVYLLTSLSYSAAAATVMLLATDPVRVKFLLLAIVTAGLVQAFVAIALYSSRGTYEFMFVSFRQGIRATGTFANPDHLAGFMELCLAAGLGLAVSLLGAGKRLSMSWTTLTVASLKFLLSPTMVLRMVLVVMVIALIMTRSRMGNAAFFIALLAVGGWVAIVSVRYRRIATMLVVSVVIIDLIIIGQWVGLDRVVDRIQDTAILDDTGMPSDATSGAVRREETLQERLRAPSQALTLVRAHPWFGTGGGTFYAVFPPYKTFDMAFFYEHTHNDFIEVAADVGLVGLALWIGIALVTLPQLRYRMRDTQPRLNAGVAVSAALACCCMLLHSLVDFNLQIPSNALFLVVLLTLPWAPGLSSRSTEPRSRGKATSSIALQPIAQPGSD